MERPKVTKKMILEACANVAASLDGDAEAIARHYRHPMDGYQIARELDRYESWDLSMSDVEELDAISGLVDRIHRYEEHRWVEENDIQPPLPIGTTIKQGVIDSVCTYSPATYRVRENGCTEDGRFLLIKFENAVVS